MDDDHSDPIEQLLVAAAAIMEDTSAAILVVGRQSLAQRVTLLSAAGANLTSLAQGAAVLLDRSITT